MSDDRSKITIIIKPRPKIYTVFYTIGHSDAVIGDTYSQWIEYLKEEDQRLIRNMSCNCMHSTMEQSRHPKDWERRKLCWHLNTAKKLFEKNRFQRW